MDLITNINRDVLKVGLDTGTNQRVIAEVNVGFAHKEKGGSLRIVSFPFYANSGHAAHLNLRWLRTRKKKKYVTLT